MATIPHTTAHISTSPLNPSAFPFATSTKRAKKFPQVFRCALSTPKWQQSSSSRRLVSISLLASHLFTFPNHAKAASFLDKYVKKKKLDPLEAYVPAVILTQFQIKDLEKTLEVDQPQFANCRSLLRSGPAASLRVNIRAVAQYASDAGSGNTAFNDVDQCLRALEELDSLLLHASRNEPDASVKSMRAKISVALDALDSLLNTVPPDVLNKGKAIADAYRSPEEEKEPEILDPELKELESIL
ncbi:uncharacterized protein LOC8258582 isoform X1 [Ricinus communis]|uniref:uncharacterized protein LOC8258582 isoform X1 n=1 Tax=Ricinus communis TaxID=3988 RepID=UPI0007724390|nr:uncharacterized protein LOC8258582 isoform X1 [Ricinus communis]|eukprot:XP_015572912.1 LOW QUALITY PROTEIN: uncharacterized protein LOC8258582 [Ricinus communis]